MKGILLNAQIEKMERQLKEEFQLPDFRKEIPILSKYCGADGDSFNIKYHCKELENIMFSATASKPCVHYNQKILDQISSEESRHPKNITHHIKMIMEKDVGPDIIYETSLDFIKKCEELKCTNT